MSIRRPHYLLFSECRIQDETESSPVGHWRFVLETVDGEDRLEAADREFNLGSERLQLLSVIRGLEALDQPSRVTLITPSRYVTRGMRFGLHHWRHSNWCWEYDGEMRPIKNRDLWQRLDQTLQFHQVRCRWLRLDVPQRAEVPCIPRPHFLARQRPGRQPRTCSFWRRFQQHLKCWWASMSARVHLHPAA